MLNGWWSLTGTYRADRHCCFRCCWWMAHSLHRHCDCVEPRYWPTWTVISCGWWKGAWEDCDVVILLSGPDAMICDDKFALVFEVKLENTWNFKVCSLWRRANCIDWALWHPQSVHIERVDPYATNICSPKWSKSFSSQTSYFIICILDMA